MGLPCGSDGKESVCKAGDLCLIPGSGRSPGGGNGNPLQDSCLENPMDREAWRAIVHEGRKESDTTLFLIWLLRYIHHLKVDITKYMGFLKYLWD